VNLGDAHEALDSPSARIRLEGARALSDLGQTLESDELRERLRRETDRWVRAALQRLDADQPKSTRRRARGRAPRIEVAAADTQIRGAVVEELTKRFLHELAPILASLRENACAELGERFDKSRTRGSLDRFARLLDGFERLHVASLPGTWVEFDLAGLVEMVARDERSSDGSVGLLVEPTENQGPATTPAIRAVLIGARPCLVHGVPSLVEMALRQGVRNAIEAMAERVDDPVAQIEVRWSGDPTDTWVAVLDEGVGLPIGSDRAFGVATTNKSRDKHGGMGLPIALQAAQTLGGDATLSPRDPPGASFRLTWPHAAGGVAGAGAAG
jgi:signal transduction histidine kinase